MRACAVTPDARRVVSESDDGTFKVWELDTGRALVTFGGHANDVTACAVTPDGRRVVSASLDRTLRVWDLDIGRALGTWVGHTNGVMACVVTPDGRRDAGADTHASGRGNDQENTGDEPGAWLRPRAYAPATSLAS